MKSFPTLPNDEAWMREAMELAKTAERYGEVPIGAIIVKENQLISQGHNSAISSHDATAHAEVMAIRRGASALENYRLTDTTLYVTLEPCMMCIGAIIHARIARVVFGAFDPRAGAVLSRANLLAASWVNHRVAFREGVLAAECGLLLKDFFMAKRKKTS